MASVTENQEKRAFDELKTRMEGDMEDEMYEDDNLFYKFLKARDFKVDDSEYMLRQHLEWRKKYDIKNILQFKPIEVFEKYFILTMIGHDKSGCIVKYNNFTKTDFRGIFESCKFDDFLKSLNHLFEKDILELKRQSKKLGKIVDKVSYIEDFENFSFSQATDRKVIFQLVAIITMYLNNYPETLKAVYAINTPVYFNLFFSILKQFLPATVVRKIKIYSDDSFKKELQEIIDAEVLPAFLGGKRRDPDGNPLCLTLIRNSELVPKSYYLSTTKRSFISLPDVQKITISKARVHEVHLEIKQPGSDLEWEFQLKSGDIKFGIFYQDSRGTKIQEIPIQRLKTNEQAESGLYKCNNAGTYILVFDNSYSLIRSKELYYKIKVNDLKDESSH